MKTIYLSLIALLTFILFSCQNTADLNPSTADDDIVLKSAEIAENDILTDAVAEELNYEAELFSEAEHLLRRLAKFRGHHNILRDRSYHKYEEGYAPEVSIDTAETGYPIVITIDYGDSTIFKNGRIVSGIVEIEISAERGTDGATRTITYNNCTVDSVGIDGMSVETFNGDNETTRMFTTSSEITFVLGDTLEIVRTGNHVRNWLAGVETEDHADDEIEKTGQTTVVTSTGNAWERNIVEPLLRLGDCRHYVQGTVELVQNDIVLATLDFGDGACDELAYLTVDGETIEVELQGQKPDAKTGDRGKKKNHKGRH